MSNEALRAVMQGIQGGSEEAYESTRVARALSRLRPDISVPQLKAANGGRPLDFSMLHKAVPEFPVRLTALHVPHLHKVTIADLVGGFFKTPIAKAYEDLRLANNWDLDREFYGLVTGWSQLPEMVMHNWVHEEAQNEVRPGAVRFVVFSSKGQKPRTYILEPFDDLLEAVRRMLPE